MQDTDHRWMDRQTDRLTEMKTDRDRQADWQTDGDRRTDRQTDNKKHCLKSVLSLCRVNQVSFRRRHFRRRRREILDRGAEVHRDLR